MNFTPQQLTFMDELRDGTANLSLEAVAGAGKTTTMKGGVQGLSGNVACLAFNKRIAETLQKEMPSSVTAATFNSVGHRAWAATVGGRLRLEVDKLSILGEEMGLKKRSYGVSRVVAQAKQAGIKPEELHEAWVEDQADALELYKPPALKEVREMLEKSIDSAYRGLIDFNDQLYMPTRFGGVFTKYDKILVDEAQDVSPIQADMIKKMGRATARYAFIGDPHQAIYGFRGAGITSMEDLHATFSTKPLPLTVSFRCAKRVVELARKFVSHITSADGAPEGTIQDLRSARWKAETLQPGDTVLCRNNAPLLGLALRLAARGYPVHVVGKEFGKGIINFLNNYASGASRDVYAQAEKELLWKISKASQEGRLSIAERAEEKLEAIQALYALAPAAWSDWHSQLQKLFSVPIGTAIQFSSIHRAKGLEWSRVFLLDWELIPSKKVREEWQLQQEYNLAYVALTRVKGDGQLTFLNSGGYQQ